LHTARGLHRGTWCPRASASNPRACTRCRTRDCVRACPPALRTCCALLPPMLRLRCGAAWSVARPPGVLLVEPPLLLGRGCWSWSRRCSLVLRAASSCRTARVAAAPEALPPLAAALASCRLSPPPPPLRGDVQRPSCAAAAVEDGAVPGCCCCCCCCWRCCWRVLM
jgi:hypothetical protein